MVCIHTLVRYMGLEGDDVRVLNQVRWLSTVIVSFAAWLPARAYANHYESHFGMIAGSNSSVVFALIMIVLMLLLLQLDLLLRNPEWFEKAKMVFVACVAASTIVLVQVPAVADRIALELSSLQTVQVVVPCVIATAALVFIARNALVPLPVRDSGLWLPDDK